MYESGWSYFRIDRLGSHKLAARGRQILAMMAKRGIRLPAGSRLERAVKLTEDRNDSFVRGDVLKADDPRIPEIMEAWRTVWEALVVVHAIVEGRGSAKALENELLAAFLSGADLPSDDKNPLARNLQFEAFVAANLVHSGLSVERAEPDFRLLYWNDSVGIAAKRVTSLKASKIYDNMLDAAQQIETHTGRGFIALSVDNWMEDVPRDLPNHEIGPEFTRRLKEAYTKLPRIAGRASVLGVLIHANWSRFVFDGPKPQLDFTAPQQVLCFGDTPADEVRSRDFFEPARERWAASMERIARLVAIDD